MYKSLFGRLFVSFTAIILISFIMLGVLLSQVLKAILFTKAKIMLEQGEKYLSNMLIYFAGIIDLEQLSFEIQVLDKYLDAMIWIVDTNGRI